MYLYIYIFIYFELFNYLIVLLFYCFIVVCSGTLRTRVGRLLKCGGCSGKPRGAVAPQRINNVSLQLQTLRCSCTVGVFSAPHKALLGSAIRKMTKN